MILTLLLLATAGMARVVQKHGKKPKVRQLAEQVIAAQEKAIEMMRGWLAQSK
jgi:uncharacterized protein (DUF305 family)